MYVYTHMLNPWYIDTMKWELPKRGKRGKGCGGVSVDIVWVSFHVRAFLKNHDHHPYSNFWRNGSRIGGFSGPCRSYLAIYKRRGSMLLKKRVWWYAWRFVCLICCYKRSALDFPFFSFFLLLVIFLFLHTFTRIMTTNHIHQQRHYHHPYSTYQQYHHHRSKHESGKMPSSIWARKKDGLCEWLMYIYTHSAFPNPPIYRCHHIIQRTILSIWFLIGAID